MWMLLKKEAYTHLKLTWINQNLNESKSKLD